MQNEYSLCHNIMDLKKIYKYIMDFRVFQYTLMLNHKYIICYNKQLIIVLHHYNN